MKEEELEKHQTNQGWKGKGSLLDWAAREGV